MSRVILRGRSDIVGALHSGFPKVLAYGSTQFPIQMRLEAPAAWRKKLELQSILAQSGAVHLIATGVDTPGKFQTLLNSLGLPCVEYCGGLGHRATDSAQGKVYSASDEPPGFTIEMHNEKADTPDPPDVISFWCQVPAEPDCGGETVLLHSDAILKGLDAGVLLKLEEKKVCYWRRLKDQRQANYLSWQAVFQTSRKVSVEEYLRNQGFTFEWQSQSDALTYWNVLPPTKQHPITGRRVWCNSIQSHHSSYYSVHPNYRSMSEPLFTTFYGDQTPIEDWVLQHIREVSWAGAVGFQMGRHDIVIADNHQVQHGRMAFSGGRKLRVAFSAPWTSAAQ